MGMSGVQVLGRDRGDVTEGCHNSTRCIRHGKRGRPLVAPSHPHCPRPATHSMACNTGIPRGLFSTVGMAGRLRGCP